MKITYLTHASVFINIDGIKILTDPWLIGPCWGGELWHYPPHNYSPKNLPKPDIIFFSHGHDDHTHEPTIKKFPKKWFSSTVIAPKFNEPWWENYLNKKFKNIKFFDHNQIKKINNIDFQIFKNDLGDFDSSLKINYKNKSIFLQTDNLMSIKEADRIGKLGKIDCAFIMPFKTGPYPGFYKMSRKDKIKEAKAKNEKTLIYANKIVANLKPKYAVPYACDLGYLGNNYHVNFIHTNNKKEFIKSVHKKNSGVKTAILNPGNYLKIEKNKIRKKTTPYIKNKKTLKKFYKEKRKDYYNYQKFERSRIKKSYKNIFNTFKKKIVNEIKKVKRIKFKAQIKIIENNKNKKLILDFAKRKAYELIDNNSTKLNLKIDIESFRIGNLIEKKYLMNFLTFHNGGYLCQRFKKKMDYKEKYFWNWIYNISF